jgi:hypothetical protein
LSRFAFGINNLEDDLGISPKFSSPLGGRGFTLLDRKIHVSDVGIDEVLSNRVKVRGRRNLSCSPPPLPTGRQARPPPSRGRGFLLFSSFEGNESIMSDCL